MGPVAKGERVTLANTGSAELDGRSAVITSMRTDNYRTGSTYYRVRIDGRAGTLLIGRNEFKRAHES
jgi:hypothetical protein